MLHSENETKKVCIEEIVYFISEVYKVFASGVQFPIFGTSNNYDLKFAANFGFVIVLLFCPLFLVFEPKFLH